jgi:hypothetical protein
MTEAVQHQIAICYLLLKGDHWVPVSPDRRMTARDRSSPSGPVIMAELIAEVEGERIVGWRKIGSLLQDVGPGGPPVRRAGSDSVRLLAYFCRVRQSLGTRKDDPVQTSAASIAATQHFPPNRYGTTFVHL